MVANHCHFLTILIKYSEMWIWVSWSTIHLCCNVINHPTHVTQAWNQAFIQYIIYHTVLNLRLTMVKGGVRYWFVVRFRPKCTASRCDHDIKCLVPWHEAVSFKHTWIWSNSAEIYPWWFWSTQTLILNMNNHHCHIWYIAGQEDCRILRGGPW